MTLFLKSLGQVFSRTPNKWQHANLRAVSTIGDLMKQHKIVPDILDQAPPDQLIVKYGSLSIKPGEKVTPTQVKSPPTVVWIGSENCFYTILLIDPDAPSAKDPKFKEWHHWLIVNIPGNHPEKGEVKSEFIGAGPPKGSGLHRYVVLLFKQPGKISYERRVLTNRSMKGRANFNTRKFVKEFNLGNPVAGTFFFAEYDRYVDELFKTLGN